MSMSATSLSMRADESEEWADRILNAADSKGRRVISMLDCCEKEEEETEEGMWTPEFFGKDEHGEEETEYDEHVWTSLDNAFGYRLCHPGYAV